MQTHLALQIDYDILHPATEHVVYKGYATVFC